MSEDCKLNRTFSCLRMFAPIVGFLFFVSSEKHEVKFWMSVIMFACFSLKTFSGLILMNVCIGNQQN